MAIKTGISWCDHTFNPWWGCTKVGGSPACDNCYAERDSKRYGFNIWGNDAPRRYFTDKHWSEPLKWNKAAELAGERRRVFCMSMGDWAEGRPEQREHLLRLFALIGATPHLDWLMLTKRPQLIAALIPEDWMRNPRHNVWFGITAETQAWLDNRWEFLKRIPSVRYWLSIEPMMGPIWLPPDFLALGGCGWAIVGGESSQKRFDARPLHPRWVKSLRDQCLAADVPFHFKQWGEYSAIGSERVAKKSVCAFDGWSGEFTHEALDQHARTAHSGQISCPPFQLMHCVGRVAAGRLVDGQLWDQFPIGVTNG